MPISFYVLTPRTIPGALASFFYPHSRFRAVFFHPGKMIAWQVLRGNATGHTKQVDDLLVRHKRYLLSSIEPDHQPQPMVGRAAKWLRALLCLWRRMKAVSCVFERLARAHKSRSGVTGSAGGASLCEAARVTG
eukprot:4816440-Pleurochrysis_carterae.AAC.1